MCDGKVTLWDATKITHNSQTLPPFSHVITLLPERVTQLLRKHSVNKVSLLRGSQCNPAVFFVVVGFFWQAAI